MNVVTTKMYVKCINILNIIFDLSYFNMYPLMAKNIMAKNHAIVNIAIPIMIKFCMRIVLSTSVNHLYATIPNAIRIIA